MRRLLLLFAVGVVTSAALAPGVATAPRVPSVAEAKAAVQAIVRGHARACRLSFDDVTARPIRDPVVRSVTVGWRVEARVRRFGEARLRAVAGWRVDARGARPDSPLAGQLAIGCAHVDRGPPRTREQWHSLPYLDASGSLYLTGNEGWAGSTSTVPTGRSELSFARHPWGERFRFVWGSTCTTARQTVSLQRTLYLPGVPAEAAVSLASVAVRPGLPATNPISSLRLLVNGRVAFAVSGSGAPAAKLPPGALRLFAYGPNRVELVGEKGTSPACNSGGKSLQIGIAFELTGRFHSALSSASPRDFSVPGFHQAGTTYFGRTSRKTGGRAGSFRFAIGNGGPSGTPGATFSLDLTGTARIAFLARTVSRNIAGCETSDATQAFNRPPPYRIVCLLTDLEPGPSLQLELKYRFAARSGFAEQSLRLAWELYSPQAGAPARGVATVVFCGTQATSAGCARAP